jgi:hypothetical protein
MDTTAPQSGATTAGTAGITSIADDRVEGWAAIIEAVCGQNTTLREGRQRLTNGKYPIWREGRRRSGACRTGATRAATWALARATGGRAHDHG